ncbi:MAG: hypothetical protein ACRDWY_18230 [Actinomycetes bacterium]
MRDRVSGARRTVGGCVVMAALLAGFAWLSIGSPAQADGGRAAGAGHTIIEGGTGGANPAPVTTLVSFHADSSGGSFECLALAPAADSGPGSGEFTTNAMYVTGRVTSLSTEGRRAVMRGVATVTGIGAGQNLPFEAVVHAGGPGTIVVLEVSGLTFRETLIDGRITVR